MEGGELVEQATLSQAIRLAGDPHPLTEAVGAPAWGGRVDLPSSRIPAVRDMASLRRFLEWYRTELLAPVELKSILRAAEHCRAYEPRELIALDQELGARGALRDFAEASRAVGRSQLRRLLPMRDQKLVRRYWEAVEAGRAHGWHMLVFGLVLGLFYIPHCQGLLVYARQTTFGFVRSALRRGAIGWEEADAAAAELEAEFPKLLRGAIKSRFRPKLLGG